MDGTHWLTGMLKEKKKNGRPRHHHIASYAVATESISFSPLQVIPHSTSWQHKTFTETASAMAQKDARSAHTASYFRGGVGACPHKGKAPLRGRWVGLLQWRIKEVASKYEYEGK